MPSEIFKIEVTGLDQIPEAFMDAARRGAAVGVEESLQLLERAVKEKILQGRDVRNFGPAIFTGTLEQHVVHEMGESVNPEGFVGVAPPADVYALTLEEGRTPGARVPPSDALVPWAEEKLGVSGTEKQIRGVAFVIARAIGWQGFPGVHMFRNAAGEQEANVVKIVKQRINEALAKEFLG